MTFPTSTALLAKLLNCFREPNYAESGPLSNDINLASLAVRSSLLTLHAIYPTVLLPALDLLDRRAITRLTLRISDPKDEDVAASTNSAADNHTYTESGASKVDAEQESYRLERSLGNAERFLYLVNSSNNREHSGQGRYSKRGDLESCVYEVHLKAWSCSCAAFAFAGFNLQGSFDRSPLIVHQNDNGHSKIAPSDEGNALEDPKSYGIKIGELDWGGLMLDKDGSKVPICKHLLACVVSECWHVANAMVEWREVEPEEMAGWAAGWGG